MVKPKRDKTITIICNGGLFLFHLLNTACYQPNANLGPTFDASFVSRALLCLEAKAKSGSSRARLTQHLPSGPSGDAVEAARGGPGRAEGTVQQDLGVLGPGRVGG